MKTISILAGVALSALTANAAMATTETVSAFSGPWSLTANPSLPYGVGDNIAPTVLTLDPSATSVTITYLSGLTSAFGGVPPSVDALGYVGSIFGSGTDGTTTLTGIGSSMQPFPSYSIDPSNSGPFIYLNALIGAFTDASGVVIGTPFATGDGPFNIPVPVGATYLDLGVNDDIFSDNSGALLVDVTGVSSVPEPSTWALMVLGFAGLGFAGYRRANKSRAATAG